VSALYLGASALDRLARAQQILDEHVAVAPLGRCGACGGEEPCPARAAAETTFGRYGRLPRRLPGRSGAGAGTGARTGSAGRGPTSPVDWFGPPPTAARPR
jgi:hypothetical protein